MDEIRCSMCGKPNSADSTICQHCGARLTPLTPSNAGKFTGGLSWLDAFREETGGSDKSQQNPEPVDAGPVDAEQDDTPDWLQHIRERTEGESTHENDEFIQYDETETNVEQDSGSDVPDWLRNLKEESASPVEEVEPVPHWTAALRTWTDDKNQEPLEESEPEEEEFISQDQPPKVTDWFNRILPTNEKPVPDQEDEEFIDDRDEKVLLDDVDMTDWREKSASLSSIRDSSEVNHEIPSWLENDASAPTSDPSENLMEWLQTLDEKEGGKSKQKARYWMGEVDTGELPKQKDLDARFAEKEESSLPVYDPFSGTESGVVPKPDHKATQFFTESDLDEPDNVQDRQAPGKTAYFEDDEKSSDADLPPWMKSVPDVPPTKTSYAPKMTAALDPDDVEIPDWMKDQPEDQFMPGSKSSLMTAALSGLDDEALGMDLPADEIPPWMKEDQEDKQVTPRSDPIMTAILDESDEETDVSASIPPERTQTPIMTAQLSGLDDEDLGMDLPVDEPAPWMKKIEEVEEPVKQGPSIMTAALRALEEIPDEEEETPSWMPKMDQVEEPVKQKPSMMTAALRILEEEDTQEEEIPPWMQELEEVVPPSRTSAPLMTAALSGLDEEIPVQEEEIPPWMQELEEVVPPSRTPASFMTAALSGLDEETPAQEEEIPPWMQELEEVVPPTRTPAPLMTAALSGLDEETPAQEEEIPPWMQELEEVVPPTRTSAPLMTAALSGLDEEIPAQEEEIPSWMIEPEDDHPPASRIATPVMTANLSDLDDDLETKDSEDDIPAWMKNLEEASSLSRPQETAVLGGTKGFDDFDIEPGEQDTISSQPLMPAFSDEELEETDSSAAFLSESDSMDDEILPVGLGLTQALKEEIPDWLSSFGEEVEPENVPLDTWTNTSGLDLQPETEEILAFEQEDEEEMDHLLPESTVPEWLSEMKQGEDSSQSGVKPAFTFESDELTPENLEISHPFAGDDLPNWLSPEIWQADSKKGEEPTTEIVAEGVENIQWELEGLEKGELPTWLHQIKPGQTVKPKRRKPEPGEEDTQTEKIGPLAGLMGVLPSRDMDMMYRKPPIYSDQIQLTERQSNRMQVLTRMIESEAKNQPLKVAVEKVPLNLMHILFAILLVVVMIIPFMGVLPMPGSLPLGVSDSVIAFFNQVEQYPENSSVLLVMDFESGYTAEMRSTLDGLLNRLYEKRVNVALVSTLPIGPVLAEEIAQDIWLKHFAAHPETNVAEYESRVVNLGYMPGGSTAMLQFIRNPRQTAEYGFRYEKNPSSVWNSSVLSSIQTVDDFAGLIVVTDSSTVSRDWIEQSSVNALNRIVMVTSAQSYPLILPYWQSGQIKGLIGGLYQGYSYRSLLNQSMGLAAKWYSYQFGMNLVTMITILLTLVYIVRNTFFGRKTPR